jgi:hypothetical protein
MHSGEMSSLKTIKNARSRTMMLYICIIITFMKEFNDIIRLYDFLIQTCCKLNIMLNKQEDIFHRANIANVISAWHKLMQSGLLICGV